MSSSRHGGGCRGAIFFPAIRKNFPSIRNGRQPWKLFPRNGNFIAA